MKRLFILLTFAVLTLTGSMTIRVKANVINLADPTIFYEDGIYYLTGTLAGDGFIMYMSPDMVHWSRCGYAHDGLALYKDDVFGTANFWAPQIIKHDNKYYIAYAANEQIGIAVANAPEGPYKSTTKKEISHDTGQIDPFIFVDDDGKAYMYYVRFTGGNDLWVAEMNSDWTDIQTSTLTKCLSASDGTWENAGNYSTYHVTEGPTVIKDGDYYYLLYSANDYRDIDYSVGYAYSSSPKGPWRKAGRPFLSRHNTGINGSGHGDLFKGEDDQWYYVFHVHASNTTVQTRRTAIVPITLTDNPRNKFIPDTDRMLILDDNAGDDAEFPEPKEYVEHNGVRYLVTDADNGQAMTTFKDAVLFGGYEGSITIPASFSEDGKEYSVTGIGQNTFYNCPKLTGATIAEGVKQIGVSAFENSGLKEVSLPTTITSIGYRAFAKSNDLEKVVNNKPTPTTISSSTFSENTLANGTLWVPTGAVNKYRGRAVWKDFATILEIEDTGIEEIETADKDNTIAYDLQGRLIKDTGTIKRGIYITNGKKVVTINK